MKTNQANHRILRISCLVIFVSLANCKTDDSKLDSLWGEHENTAAIISIKAEEGIKRAIRIAKAQGKCQEGRAVEEIALAMHSASNEDQTAKLVSLVNESDALREYLSTSIYLNVFDNDETLKSHSAEELARVLSGARFTGMNQAKTSADSRMEFSSGGRLIYEIIENSKRSIGRWTIQGEVGQAKQVIVNCDFGTGAGEEEVKMNLNLDSNELGFNGNYVFGLESTKNSLSSLKFSNIDKSCRE